MRRGQEVAVQAGLTQAVHGHGEAVRWRQGGQRSLQLRLREELLPVLQVGRVHLQEGRATGLTWLQHGCWGGGSREEEVSIIVKEVRAGCRHVRDTQRIKSIHDGFRK